MVYEPPKMPPIGDLLPNRYGYALSIREPWITAILLFGKRFENRPRRSHYRGRIYLHASKTYDKEGHKFLTDNGFIVPPDLKTEGIKGYVELIGCVEITDAMREQSIFATGPHCLVLDDPKPLRFLPCKGQLAIPFKVDLYDLRAQDGNSHNAALYG